tara:strand:- start:48682 stop:50742 length:2061 start_codon:yes stop_codon:yes gene_type:complete
MAKNKPNENKGSKLDEKITEKILGIEQEINETIEERLIMQDQTVKSKKEALDIMKRQQSRQDKLKEAAQKWKDHWKEFKEIAKDPKIATGAFLVASADKAKDIGNSFLDMQKSAGLAYTQTANMSGVLASSVSSGWMVGVGFKASAEAAGALSDELGDIGEVTSGAVKNIASMAHSYGISNSEAAKLTKAVKNISGDSTDVASNMLLTAKEMAISANVAPGKVIKDMAGNTELLAGFSQDGGKNFAETAVQAGKLGISLSDVSSMLNGILDVESSIEKEMEASVLLNRQISFDKARQLAMSGDTLGATKAILEQVGGIAEWENMSIMQRKSLAEAAGVELGVMNSMINSRDKQVEMGLIEASTSEKTLKTMVGIGSTIKNNATWLASTANFSAMIFKQANLERLKQAAHWVKELAHSVKMKLFGGENAVTDKGKELIQDKGSDLLDQGKDKVMEKLSGGADEVPGGGMMKGMAKIDMNKVLKGAAAMVIVAAAVFVFGKAVQEFMGVSWSAVGMAVVSMLALVGAVAILGAIMSSGVGALAIIAGAGAMLIVAAAVYVLGKALQEMATGFDMMGSITSQLVELVLLAPSMVLAAAGFIAMGYGLVALSAGLLLLTPMLPVLMALGGLTAIGMSLFGGESEAKEGGDNIIAEKLDTLIDLIGKGGTINMDGKKVGDVIALAQGPLGS